MRDIKPEETPTTRANFLTERLDGNRNGRHGQLRAPMLRRAGPQSRQDCSTELLLRPECAQDVVTAV